MTAQPVCANCVEEDRPVKRVPYRGKSVWACDECARYLAAAERGSSKPGMGSASSPRAVGWEAQNLTPAAPTLSDLDREAARGHRVQSGWLMEDK